MKTVTVHMVGNGLVRVSFSGDGALKVCVPAFVNDIAGKLIRSKP